jgi:hypothetical protein
MKRLIVLAAAILMSVGIASAQNYNYGIGLRLNQSPSIDFKWNHTATNSWEFNLSMPNLDGVTATAAYQWNWAIGSQGYNGDGFNAYVGPQATIGMYSKSFTVGVGALGGIEYKFDIPLALGIDWKPTFAFGKGGLDNWGFWDFAIAVRYTF